jgi:hypothetical protein
MSIEQVVLEKLRQLPLEKQQEALDFVAFLESRQTVPFPRHNPIGLLADLNVDVTAEDIAEARREMWDNFPRDIEL